MILYRYRSVKRALSEIDDGVFYFATHDELNDPIEGYVKVFWQGDKFAWEGLLRNYIHSLSKAIIESLFSILKMYYNSSYRHEGAKSE